MTTSEYTTHAYIVRVYDDEYEVTEQGPVLAAAKLSCHLELEKGTTLRVQNKSGRWNAYSVGNHSRSLNPMGRVEKA